MCACLKKVVNAQQAKKASRGMGLEYKFLGWEGQLEAPQTRTQLLSRLASHRAPSDELKEIVTGHQKKNVITRSTPSTPIQNFKSLKSKSENANHLDVPKSGPNPVSDKAVDFLKNWAQNQNRIPTLRRSFFHRWPTSCTEVPYYSLSMKLMLDICYTSYAQLINRR